MGAACPSPVRISKINKTTTSSSSRSTTANDINIPTIDLSLERGVLADVIVRACEEHGFFWVVNHGVSPDIIGSMEKEGFSFFGKPAWEKQRAGPPNPFGYGSKNIGFNGDMGELEYLLLQTNPVSISQTTKAISHDPLSFRCAVNDYVAAVRGVACEILDLAAEGLRLSDKTIFSNLIRDAESDSCFRLNHYPPLIGPSHHNSGPRLGFGEHSDPQILTVLRSNDVAGLQLCLEDEMWVPVRPKPTGLCVFVGDAFQAMTNARFRSVRHRVLANSSVKARMSIIYFAAPPLNAWISPLPQMLAAPNSALYKPFTWAQFKKAAYSLRLGDRRLDLFKIQDPCNS